MTGQGSARGPRPHRGRPLSAARARLLEVLQAQPEPTSVPALCAMTGLHANSVREQLDGLARAGLVERVPAPNRPGRPGWLYHPTERGGRRPAVDHAAVAATLAAVLGREDGRSGAAAEETGRDWGHRMATEAGSPAGPGAAAARRKVVELFDEMGFAPQTDDDAREVRFTRCPLLEAAHQQTSVVCAMHLGIARGAMEEYGAPADDCTLQPFISPGVCLLRLEGPDAGD